MAASVGKAEKMRRCPQCQSPMQEGFGLRVEGGAYGVHIIRRNGWFGKRIEKPKVAICPNCGEISLYIENFEEL